MGIRAIKTVLLTYAASLLLLVCAGSSSTAATFVITGKGWGHGIGMSQWGAYGYAKHGFNYKQILGHYYTGTQVATSNAAIGKIRVLIKAGSSFQFSGISKIGGKAADPGRQYNVSGGSTLKVRSAGGQKLGSFPAPLVLTGPGLKKLYGTALSGVTDGRYRGAIVVRPGSAGLYAINKVGMQAYVKGVVPKESPASWPIEALKAQAVAARSYALATRKTDAVFDEYADTRSQVYGGYDSEERGSNKAVDATKGELVTYRDKVATTYFFSTSGGKTENIEDVWIGSDPVPYLKSVDDPYEPTGSDSYRWGPFKYSNSSMASKLSSYIQGTLKDVEVTDRGPGEHVVKVKVSGSGGSKSLSGTTFQSLFDLKSSWFYIEKK